MFDLILNIACALDWLTPIIAFLQDLMYGPISDFGIMANVVWGRNEIKKLLAEHGVRVWGVMYNFEGDILLFTVEEYQTNRVYNILRREGLPIVYSPTIIHTPYNQHFPIDAELYERYEGGYSYIDNWES